jgi:succinyl-CoA synthetase beta subunit
MLLYEYEGKRIFSQAKIPIPDFVLARSPDDVQKNAEKIGFPAVLKAQVLRGGRGKDGLIQTAKDALEVKVKAERIFSSERIENSIEGILIEGKIEAAKEIYLGITVDRLAKKPVVVVCDQGGVDIEEIANQSPEKIFTSHVSPLQGFRFYEAIRLIKMMGIGGKSLSLIADIATKLYGIFETYDAELAEINPLMITADEEVYAADSKIIINDDALYRHPEIGDLYRNLKPLEKEAKLMGLTYVDLQPGNVAVISSGAGYTMMVLDLIRSFGGEPANFMDSIVDSRERMQKAVEFIVKRAKADPRIGSILLLKTMSYTPLDRMMGAIKDALEGNQCPVPIVSCLRATGNAIRNMSMEEAENQLKALGIQQHSSLRDAVKAAVDMAQGALKK